MHKKKSYKTLISHLWFQEECGKRLINMDIALEDDSILNAIKIKDVKQILYLLDNNF